MLINHFSRNESSRAVIQVQADSFIENFAIDFPSSRTTSEFSIRRQRDRIHNKKPDGNLPLSVSSSFLSISPVGTLPIKSNRRIQLKLDPVFTEVQQDACSMRTNIETSKADIASRRLNSVPNGTENASWIKAPLFPSFVTFEKSFIHGHPRFNLAPFTRKTYFRTEMIEGV